MSSGPNLSKENARVGKERETKEITRRRPLEEEGGILALRPKKLKRSSFNPECTSGGNRKKSSRNKNKKRKET